MSTSNNSNSVARQTRPDASLVDLHQEHLKSKLFGNSSDSRSSTNNSTRELHAESNGLGIARKERKKLWRPRNQKRHNRLQSWGSQDVLSPIPLGDSTVGRVFLLGCTPVSHSMAWVRTDLMCATVSATRGAPQQVELASCMLSKMAREEDLPDVRNSLSNSCPLLHHILHDHLQHHLLQMPIRAIPL